MTDATSMVATLGTTLRMVLLFGGAVVAALAALDWAVRTRRINPFSGVARFMRARVEPRFSGIESAVIRVGGKPSATPWWALLAYVVLAALLLAGVDLLLSLVDDFNAASAAGGWGMVRLALHWIIEFLRVALLVRVIASWIPAMHGSRWIRWSYVTTEWMLRPLRGVLPNFGMIDLSPLIAYFGLYLVEIVLGVLLPGGGR